MMKLFRKHSQQPKAVNYLYKITSSQAFDWALNAPPERKIVWKIVPANVPAKPGITSNIANSRRRLPTTL